MRVNVGRGLRLRLAAGTLAASSKNIHPGRRAQGDGASWDRKKEVRIERKKEGEEGRTEGRKNRRETGSGRGGEGIPKGKRGVVKGADRRRPPLSCENALLLTLRLPEYFNIL